MYSFSSKSERLCFQTSRILENKVCIDLIMLRLHKYISCVYTKESLVYTQEISCACTTLLCIMVLMFVYISDVIFLNKNCRRPHYAKHRSVVHAQESCACTRISCVDTRISSVYTRDFLCRHNIHFYCYITIIIALKHFHTRLWIFSFIYTYTVD